MLLLPLGQPVPVLQRPGDSLSSGAGNQHPPHLWLQPSLRVGEEPVCREHKPNVTQWDSGGAQRWVGTLGAEPTSPGLWRSQPW